MQKKEMKRRKLVPFLMNVIFCNLISLLLYLLCAGILNVITEGKISAFAQAEGDWQHSATAVSHTAKIIIQIITILLSVVANILFFILSFITLKRNSRVKDDFLKEIGYKSASYEQIRNEYMRKCGFYYSILFVIFVSIIMFFDLINVPFVSMLVMPLYIPYSCLLSLCDVSPNLNNVFLFIFTIIGNGFLYYIYQKFAVPHLYNKWAQERLHIENE